MSSWDAAFDGPPIATEPAHAAPGRWSARPVPSSDSDHARRPAVQGLRALAVVAVVVNHLTGHPQGGFVGVDVFFVISGFLITGSLLGDLARSDGRTGLTPYLLRFYARRVRRLLPAAFVVLAVSLGFAKIVFNAARFHTTWTDGLWSAGFSANWHFIDVGTDYFTAAGPVSPFQHFWSLAVEEQFYLVWPIVLFALATMAASLTRRARAVATIAVVLSAASFCYALLSHDSTTNYFSTFSRAWELGIGAVLAVLIPKVRAGAGVLTACSLLGTASILAAYFVIHGGSGFPAPYALWPCLGAALVIVSTAGPAANPVLTNPVSVLIGDASYSIYLVHFPVIVLISTWWGPADAAYYVFVVAIIVGASALLYGVIERPILASSFLISPGHPAQRDAPDMSVRLVAALSVGLIVVATTCVPLFDLNGSARDHEYRTIASALAASPGALSSDSELSTLHAALRAALVAKAWPTLTPTMNDVLAPSRPFTPQMRTCGGTALLLSTCTFGAADAPHTIMLVGDSTSIAYAPAFVGLVKLDPTWKVVVAGGIGCNFGDTVYTEIAVKMVAACPARQVAVNKAIVAVHPDILVITNRHDRNSSYTPLEQSMERVVDSVRSSVRSVVVLPPPPSADDPHACYAASDSPVNCVSTIQGDDATWLATQQAMARDLHATYISTLDWFCQGGYCPDFESNRVITSDGNHLTTAYSADLAPIVLQSFRPLLTA